ncbi:YihY/virulence factor BrkB family protein [Streptomyces sp. NPDC004959]|uniref:YihY/virulence factor BrkB family protein n=1 Tax=unclassified Streptomyces TaxID=2593676 RepID=UPI00056BE86E|nr:YihY/virulence factor BrkB family protein [Streptomyces sp. NRRL F-5630]
MFRYAADWWPALRRTPLSLWNDDVTDDAAALTYYAMLALLPALLVTVVASALLGPDTARTLIAYLTDYAPGQAGPQLHDLLTRMLTENATAWPLIATGVFSAFWSACSYLAVFRRSLHRMHRTADARTPVKRAHRIVLTALTLLGLLVLTALLLVLSNPVVDAIGRALHLDEGVALAWRVLRWPALLCLVSGLAWVAFSNGPRIARRRRYSLPGGVLATVLWLLATAGFTLYTSLIGTYSALYGSLAGIVVFLIWLWLSNLALLAGAQFAAELGKADRAGTEEEAEDGARKEKELRLT